MRAEIVVLVLALLGAFALGGYVEHVRARAEGVQRILDTRNLEAPCDPGAMD